ncbi:hypothetical protein C8Q80DRAFT_346441 [Daedaleopsis nitida]|nr:hypothetical protein C8Q80DRAFT_346441 [Daedaleopsis nitida]
MATEVYYPLRINFNSRTPSCREPTGKSRLSLSALVLPRSTLFPPVPHPSLWALRIDPTVPIPQTPRPQLRDLPDDEHACFPPWIALPSSPSTLAPITPASPSEPESLPEAAPPTLLPLTISTSTTDDPHLLAPPSCGSAASSSPAWSVLEDSREARLQSESRTPIVSSEPGQSADSAPLASLLVHPELHAQQELECLPHSAPEQDVLLEECHREIDSLSADASTVDSGQDIGVRVSMENGKP